MPSFSLDVLLQSLVVLSLSLSKKKKKKTLFSSMPDMDDCTFIEFLVRICHGWIGAARVRFL